jgi:phage shock protein PspC (stress-responsive transcriptional regulator)
MNKTITMNLSGIIFHIEEDAYEKLNKYLSTIRGYFKDSEGRDEIMSDIEARIAEMLQEKVSNTKQAVLMSDVESVIAVMGKPEDFAGSSENPDTKQDPQEKQNTYSSGSTRRKRVFRDPDDKVFGGVCSGISNYFDLDPIWLRAAFAVAFFVFGSGLLLYIILMIIIPKAKTTAEKLEMRGEKVDINNIGKVVNEEFEDFKRKMKEYDTKENREKLRNSTEKAGDFISDVFMNIVHILAKVFSSFMVFIAIAFIVVLLGSVFGMNFIHMSKMGHDHSYNIYDIYTNFIPQDISIYFLVTGLILFFGVPLMGILYAGIRNLFNIKGKNRIVKYTFNALWLIGVGIMLYIGIRTGQGFSEETTVKQRVEIQQKDTLYLSVKDPGHWVEKENSGHSSFKIGNVKWTEYEDGTEWFSQDFPVTFDIEQSENNQFQLIVNKTASGTDRLEAQTRAKQISYNVNQDDSLIEFEPQFNIPKGDKWRSQEVTLTLKVPVGKVVYLSKSMEHIIFNIQNINNAIDYDMVNRRWVMTRQGLACIDCDNLHRITMDDTVVPAPASPPSAPLPPAGSKKYFFGETVTFK